jgi:cytochrome c551/c552
MAALRAGMAMLVGLLLAGCGGGDDDSPDMPIVAMDPADVEVAAGDTPELRVRAEGAPPLQVQWRRNGIDIPGATDERLVLPAVTPRQDGDEFDVMVSNAAGSELSRAATLTVRDARDSGAPEPTATSSASDPPPVATEPDGPTDEGLDSGPAPDGAAPGATGAAAEESTDAEADPDEDATAIVTSGEEPGDAEDDAAAGRVGESEATAPRAARAVPLAAPVPSIASQPRSVLANPGQTATFRVVARGTAPLRYQWRRDNVDIRGATSASYTTPRLTLDLNRSVYRVVVRNDAGARQSTAALLTVTERPIAPSIVTQPANLRVAVGAPATFRVRVVGSAASFQWFRDGQPIPSATGARYRLAQPQLIDSGARFRVRITNRIGTVLSLPVTLTVGDALIAPGIALQPASLTARSGASASFLVTPLGTPPFRYQWRRNGVAIAGATAARLSVPATMANQGAAYSVRVRNAAGRRLSRSAVLSVADVTAGPLLQRRNCGACHAYDSTLAGPSFRAIADRYAGQARATYLVQRIREGGRGAWGTTSMPAYPQVSLSEAGAIATWLLAGAPPMARPLTITRQPDGVVVAVGAFAHFTVAVRGVSPLTYQWRRNGALVLGATEPSYTTESLTAADDSKRISVTVSSPQGGVTSREVLMFLAIWDY